MQRYFLPAHSLITDDTAIVYGDDAHHMARVMRMKAGQQVEIVTGGTVYLAELEDVKKDSVHLRLLIQIPKIAAERTTVSLTLFQGLPKGDKIDQIIRQSCEIGVVRLAVFGGVRSVASLPPERQVGRVERWRKQAKESSEQAHRDRVPDVDYFPALTELLAAHPSGEGRLLLVPYEAQSLGLPSLKRVLRTIAENKLMETGEPYSDMDIAIAIGPEGGFDPREVSMLQAVGGQLLTLGSRILRTETAGIVVAAAISYEFDLLGAGLFP